MLTECGNLPTQELLEKTREEMGLNEPFLIQYGNWLKGVLTGDMGMSYSAKIPVSEKIRKSFWPTVQLAGMSLVFMLIISIPLGMIAAVYQNRWGDYLIRGYTFLGVSIPSFWIGLIFLRIFGVNLKWVSGGGNSSG